MERGGWRPNFATKLWNARAFVGSDRRRWERADQARAGRSRCPTRILARSRTPREVTANRRFRLTKRGTIYGFRWHELCDDTSRWSSPPSPDRISRGARVAGRSCADPTDSSRCFTPSCPSERGSWEKLKTNGGADRDADRDALPKGAAVGERPRRLGRRPCADRDAVLKLPLRRGASRGDGWRSDRSASPSRSTIPDLILAACAALGRDRDLARRTTPWRVRTWSRGTARMELPPANAADSERVRRLWLTSRRDRAAHGQACQTTLPRQGTTIRRGEDATRLRELEAKRPHWVSRDRLRTVSEPDSWQAIENASGFNGSSSTLWRAN